MRFVAWLKFLKVAVLAAMAMALLPVSAFAQTPTPMAPAALLTLVTDNAGGVIDPVQVTYFIIFAVGMSLAFWVVRRSLKLGR